MNQAIALLNYFSSEWTVIRAAPGIFFLGWVLLTATAWLIIRSANSVRHASSKSKIELLEARIADYQDRLNGASPREAAAEIAALQRTVAELVSERNPFTDATMQKISHQLRGYTGRILISADILSADPVTVQAQVQMTQFFRVEGWIVSSHRTQAVVSPPKSGIVLFMRRSNAETAFRVVSEALSAGGLLFEVRRELMDEAVAPLQLHFSDAS